VDLRQEVAGADDGPGGPALSGPADFYHLFIDQLSFPG